jgi:hypothetical protein
MKVYKVELVVLDHENAGEDGIKYLLNNVKYLYPSVMSIESREIGEWDDDHPLNKHDLWMEEMQRLFGECHDEIK